MGRASLVSGEPGDICLRLEVGESVASSGCAVHVDVVFDMMSLGRFAETILSDSEIRLGIFPGSAIVILDSMRRAVEKTARLEYGA